MRRRRFLALAGGALAPLLLRADDTTGGAPGWNQQQICSPDAEGNPSLPGDMLDSLPASQGDFTPPGDTPLRRPLWSAVKNDREYTQKLRTAYHNLWKGGADPAANPYYRLVRLHEYYC